MGKSTTNYLKKPTLAKQRAVKIVLPKEVPLLGEAFNFLYKDIFALLSDVAGPYSKQTTNSNNINILVGLAVSELHLAILRKEENYQIYTSQPKKAGTSEFQQLYEQSYKYFVNEIVIWGAYTSNVDLLIGHLCVNDRLKKIFQPPSPWFANNPLSISLSLLFLLQVAFQAL